MATPNPAKAAPNLAKAILNPAKATPNTARLILPAKAMPNHAQNNAGTMLEPAKAMPINHTRQCPRPYLVMTWKGWGIRLMPPYT